LHAAKQFEANHEAQTLERMASKHAQKLGFDFATSTSKKGLLYQSLVLRKFLQQLVLLPILLEDVENKKKSLQFAQVFEDLKLERDLEHALIVVFGLIFHS